MAYVVSRVPNFGHLLDEAYDEVRALAVKVSEEDREKKYEHADQSAEAVGDLWEVVEGGSEVAGVEVPGLSIVGIGVDLLLDPARFHRSARERQRRFFKHSAMLVGKILGTAWGSLLLFTIYDALEHRHIIGPLPAFIRETVPTWFEAQSLGGQMTSLVGLAIVGVLVALIVIRVFVWAGSSRRLTPAFELKVRDDELASNALKPLLPSIFPSGVPQETLWQAAKTVYKSVYLNSGKPNSDDMKMLEEILAGGNEKAAAAFLKSKISHYRSAMQSEAETFCRDADDVMSAIH
jgi:hypothetical protein